MVPHLKIFMLLSLFSSFLFLSLFIYQLQKVNKAVRDKREEAAKLFSYWDTIAKVHPSYPDAFYQAAWYSYVLGNREKASELLEKALLLDPDYKEARKLQVELENDRN